MKKLSVSMISQWQDLWKVLLFLYLPISLLFLVLGVWSRIDKDVSLEILMQDIVETGGMPVFTGFVSQMGNILWSASLAVCFFTLIILQRRSSDVARSKRFLLQAGIVTFILLFDDTFLFHTDIAFLYLGISSKWVVIAGYVVMGFLFVLSNWREILSSEYLLLMFALMMFATSIFFDALPVVSMETQYLWNKLELLLEDGFRFAGIATWLMYFVRYAIQQIEAMQGNRRSV